MWDFLTRVHLHYGCDYFNYYIRFGVPKYRDEYEAREAYKYYSSGSIFGYVRWDTNECGTKSWRIFILRGSDPTKAVCNIPVIIPGAEVLADISGKDRVHRYFKVIDDFEEAGIDGSDVADWYWIHTNIRINSSLDPLPYTSGQHRSWLLERKVRA